MLVCLMALSLSTTPRVVELERRSVLHRPAAHTTCRCIISHSAGWYIEQRFIGVRRRFENLQAWGHFCLLGIVWTAQLMITAPYERR